MTDDKPERIALLVSGALKRRLHDWRRSQRDIPTLAASTRFLMELGLDAVEAQAPSEKKETAA
jgi:hypothetical protein